MLLSAEQIEVFRYYAQHGSPRHKEHARQALQDLGIEVSSQSVGAAEPI